MNPVPVPFITAPNDLVPGLFEAFLADPRYLKNLRRPERCRGIAAPSYRIKGSRPAPCKATIAQLVVARGARSHGRERQHLPPVRSRRLT